jgi:hypothetical protein
MKNPIGKSESGTATLIKLQIAKEALENIANGFDDECMKDSEHTTAYGVAFNLRDLAIAALTKLEDQ